MSAWCARSFRAMGSDCRIVAPDARFVELGVDVVQDAERRWSRFLAESEVRRLNAADGQLCIVSPPTFELVRRAEAARRSTDGWFHPLLLDHLVAAGYDRTWSEVIVDAPDPAPAPPAVSAEPIELFDDVGGVRLPRGTRFDPGGLGKGLAGDLVARALLDAGAERAQIELGGDVRLVGDGWDDTPWVVNIDDRGEGTTAGTVRLPAGGAVATSSRRRRRWTRHGVELHHLIDPRTGTSADTDLVTVTVVAAELWWAEVIAKVALIEGSEGARRRFARHGVTGMIVHADSASRARGRHELVGVAA